MFQYLEVLALLLLVTFPLELFARVYRRPRRLAITLGMTLLLFVGWLLVAKQRHLWSLNPFYVTGWQVVDLPIEEVGFFIVIPICGLLIYETVRRAIGKRDA